MGSEVGKDGKVEKRIGKENYEAFNRPGNPQPNEVTGSDKFHIDHEQSKAGGIMSGIAKHAGAGPISENTLAGMQRPSISASGLAQADIDAYAAHVKATKPALEKDHPDMAAAAAAVKDIKAADIAKTSTPEQLALAKSVSTKDITFAPQGDKLIATLTPEEKAKLNDVLKDKSIDPTQLFGPGGLKNYDAEKGTITIPAADATKYNAKATEAAVSSGDPDYVKSKITAGHAENQGQQFEGTPSSGLTAAVAQAKQQVRQA